MRTPYYANTELLQLSNNCNSILELTDTAVKLKYLSQIGENINLNYFNSVAHKRIRQLLKT